jgi:hypothetical protein
MCGHLNGASTSSYPCRHLHLQQNLQRAQTCTVARSSWSEDFSVSFVFGYLAWPRCRNSFFIFTIVMFRGGVGVLHTHLGFIFPKVFPMFISHYPVS